ncbi:hypothetical protein [Klebsiella pneumoniae]|uniref:hypothetical protein n=1 Tax=Klebsiella pneumoniae TaxID=573 RepID=UPI0007CD163A|nr:hypothetical protein [Klebsiella pneumoniae]SBF32526.1 Uncharacterised protein [Klebsiella pneumoniae]SBF43599.1 Uncharacterised protein [Klebsiella pneumoniae]SBH73263.1 Uncharacterised protein [Klebsiella pneumoniae]HBV4632742.1 RDD family protein [Klebsiella pneumoniae]
MTSSEIELFFYFLTSSIVFIVFYFKQWFILTERNLFSQKLFWLSIGFPFVSFLYFGIFSWWGKTPLLNANGYTNFYEISKFPLMILATSVPLGAIVNNIHRTIQTEKQIYESKRKNNFDISINHIKYHTELFQKIKSQEITESYKTKPSLADEYIENETTFTPVVLYPIALYKKLFITNNENEDENLKINIKFLRKLKSDWKYLNHCFKRLHKYNMSLHSSRNNGKFRAAKCKIYYETCDAYETLCKTLELGNYRPLISFGSEDKDDVYQIWIPFYNQSTLYKSIKSVESLSLKIFDIIRDKPVDDFFPPNEKLFIYGPGAIHDWSYFMSDRIIMSETKNMISVSSGSFNAAFAMAANRRQSIKNT